MESTESPLDVLSRAATMVQDNIYLPPPYDEARPLNFKCKDLSANSVSGGKWKRERRQRNALVPPPDYASHALHKVSNNSNSSEPLDMSRKPRGSPPPYSASISNRASPGTGGPRPSVIISSTSSNSSSAPPSPGSDHGGSSDPVIDEHFRRSLGADYLNLYKSTSPSPTPNDSALSVDDHFAKALGDTWIKLQEADTFKKISHKSLSSERQQISESSSKRNMSSSSSTTSTLSPPASPILRHSPRSSPGEIPI